MGIYRRRSYGKPALLTAEEERTTRRIDGLRIVMEKVVRILSGKGIRIKMVEGGGSLEHVPGWTNGQDIFLNHPRFEELLHGINYTDPAFGDVVKKVKGICYHELCHILYSPREDDLTIKRIHQYPDGHRRQKLWYAYNALEDQRIERLFTARFQPSVPYFQGCVSEWITKTPEALRMAHMLIHGRTYMPYPLRFQAAALMAQSFNQQLVDDFSRVIDAYGRLSFPDTTGRAWGLIVEYADLLMKLNRADLPSQPTMDNTPTTGTATKEADGQNYGYEEEGNAIRKGQPSKKEQEAAKAAADKQQEQEVKDGDKVWGDDGGDTDADDTDDTDAEGSDSGDADGDDDGENTLPDSGNGQGTGSKPAEGAAEGDGSGTGNEPTDSDANGGMGETPDADAAQPGGGVGTGSGGQGTEITANELLDAAHELLEAMDNDAELAAEIQDIIDNVRDVVQGSDGLGGMTTPYHDEAAPGNTKQIVRKIVRELSELRLEMDAEKERRQIAGRLNMRRWLGHEAHEMDIFDQMNTEVEEAGGVEVVVLLDLSGSMGSHMTTVSQMMWAIKASMDALEIRTTILGFSDNWNVLYRPSEKALKSSYRLYNSLGGTTPMPAFQQAHKLLTSSDSPNRVLVTITDGAWSIDDNAHRKLMTDLHRRNTTSLIIGINGAASSYGTHHHEVSMDTDELKDIPFAVRNLVEQVTRKVLSTVG